MLDCWFQDFRYAARLLRRNPVFALTAALSLAIGIGANTTIFTVANALLFKPPPGVVDASRLVDVGRSQDGQGFDNSSYPNYLDIRSRNTVFDGIYAARFGGEPMSLGGPDGADRIYGNLVTANYFSVLGTRPAVGRFFSTSDGEQPGSTPLVVLSHAFWIRRFAGDPSVVGRQLVLNGRPFSIVGVAPEGFHGTTVLTSDIWVPLTMVAEVMPRQSGSILTSRPSVWLVMGARLKPGVMVPQAQAELATIGRALEQEFPDDNRGKGLRVVPQSPIPGNGAPVAAFLSILMGIVMLVLAIACANIAGVLLARATARRREIAVRIAIGAGRARLVRLMLVETLLLFLIGAAIGLALARAMTTLLVALLPALPLPVDMSLPLDARGVSFTVGLTLIAALLAGLAPALTSSRADVIPALKADVQGGPERQRLRSAFVVAQVTFGIVLVVGAGLFARAMQHAAQIDPGFDPHGVELASLDFALAGYTEASGRLFANQLVERVRALPDVRSAALAAIVPLGLGGLGLGGLSVPGVPPPPGRRFFSADWNVVTPGYFETMKTALTAGRDFIAADRADSPSVVIVNETAARQWWPGGSAIGQTLLRQDGRPEAPDAMRTLTVVGVARDGKYRSLAEDPRLFVYVPLQQQYLSQMTIVARSTTDRRLASQLRAVVRSLNPNLPILSAQTLDEYARLGLVPQQVAASVTGSLGLVGLLLAAIGVYGVTAYMVTSRTREIGIRVALGAQPRDVMRMIVGHGLVLTLAGAAIGLSLAAVAARLIASLLIGVAPVDFVTFASATVLFVVIGVGACLVPAHRALRVNAIEALRCE
jgi:putative ABC transport system permease protein